MTKSLPPTAIQTTSGSRARDHLANERTWLAWIRTAISLIILGLAVPKFAPDKGDRGVASGVILVVVGTISVLFGTLRYRTISRELEEGYFLTASRGHATTVASGVLLIAVLVSMLLLI